MPQTMSGRCSVRSRRPFNARFILTDGDLRWVGELERRRRGGAGVAPRPRAGGVAADGTRLCPGTGLYTHREYYNVILITSYS